MAVVAGTALSLPVLTVGYASQIPAANTDAVARTRVIAPAPDPLPSVPAKALQMSEAGVNDSIIISYIVKSANSYTLDSQQIVYLHDLGVSSTILKALVQHEGTAPSAPSGAGPNGAVEMQDVSSASVSAQSPPVSGAAVNFYDALAPYGTWVNVPTYGWCWQPTVEVVNPSWQPYCNNGCWLWTDQGWYWNSYYSWGWAPFHYGRWCRYHGYGWLWRPDNVWGPAWVCWRNSPGYCGWAPLPPGAAFAAGVGWTFNGLTVGINYGFGLGPSCFTFCDYDNFCRRQPFHYFRHDRDAEHFFNHSRVDNHWTLDAHHHFFDHGINPSRIEAATHTHLRQIAVRQFPHGRERSRHFVMPDRLAQNGNRRVIYRPDRDLSAMRKHFERGTPSVYHRDGQGTAHEFAFEHTPGNMPRLQSNRSKPRRASRPGIALNHPDWNRYDHNEHRGGGENPRVNHFPLAQHSHRNFSDLHRFTPVWHTAPAIHSAPVRHQPQTRQATPAWHRAAPVWHRAARAWHPVTPTVHSAPTFHRTPAFHAARIHSTPAFHRAPTFHTVHTFHPASTFHRAPAFHPAPFFHAAHVVHSTPAFHPVHVFHPAPAVHHAPRVFSGAHFSGGGRHFGGGRHR